MQTAMIRCVEIKRPISRDTIGFRLQAAEPNKAGRIVRPGSGKANPGRSVAPKIGPAVPSFRSPYFVCESSDYSSVGIGEIERFVQQCKSYGFKKFEALGELAELFQFVKVD